MTNEALPRATLPIAFAARHGVAVALFAMVLAIFLVPVLYFPFPEGLDYPNHLARMYAIGHLPGDTLLARYYEIRWHLFPNLAMDLLVPPLAHFVGVVNASKLFVALTLVLLATGPAAVASALFGECSVLCFASFAFAFNGISVIGFTNFLFGVGIAVWGLAAWIAFRGAGPAKRWLVAFGFAAVLFITHLHALGLYGLAIFSYEVWRAIERRARGESMIPLVDVAIFAVPFACCALLLVTTSTASAAGLAAWGLDSKLLGIAFVVKIFTKPVAIASLAGLTALVIWGIATRQLRWHPVGIAIALGGALLFLVMPYKLFGSAYADSRLPIAIVFLVLGTMRWQPKQRAQTAILAAALAALIIMRYADAFAGTAALQASYADFERSFQYIRPGSKLLTAEANVDRWHLPLKELLMTHMPTLAIAERSSLDSLAFTDPSSELLETRPAMRPYVAIVGWPPQLSYLLTGTIDPEATNPPAMNRGYYLTWRQHYDYVYLLFAPPGTVVHDPALSLLYQGADFQLYAVTTGEPPGPRR